MTIESGRKVTGYTVVCQLWLETERGWGTRPDGYSLHLTEADREEYVLEHWNSQPRGYVPDEYSRPHGDPFTALVDEETFARVSAHKHVREYRGETPPEYRP